MNRLPRRTRVAALKPWFNSSRETLCMFWILRLAVLILLIVWVFRQVRKPSGPLGRRVVRAMNLSHSKMTDWGLQQLAVPKNAAILDAGCGAGQTVRKLAASAPGGKIVGLDSRRPALPSLETPMPMTSRPGESRSCRVRFHVAIPRLHVRRRHCRRDALLLARPAYQSARDSESP
jgi:hypothetical protein